MAELKYYVDTDVVGGSSDGSDWDNAYSSLQAAETARAASLNGDWIHYVVSGSSADGITVINGTTMTTSADYILIEAASETGHQDRAVAEGWKTDRYRISGADDNALLIQDDYVRVSGLQVEVTDIDANYESPIYVLAIAASNLIRIYGCRLRGNNDGTNRNRSLTIADDDIDLELWNTILTGSDGAAGSVSVYLFCNTAKIYNCVVYGGTTDGIASIAGTIDVYNTVVFSTGDDWQGTFNSINNCAYDDGDSTTNEVDETGGVGDGWDDNFTNAAGGDFTLKSGSHLIGEGAVDPGSGLFSDDMDGTTRGAAWDVGVFEYVAAGGGSAVPIIFQQMRWHRN